MVVEKDDLKSKTIGELKKIVTEELQEKSFRATQIFRWIHNKNIESFNEMTDLSQKIRNQLENLSYITTFDILDKQKAGDGTVKYLFGLKDGITIESVYLPYSDGRKSICISSQAGCSIGCSFCATGKGGFLRNLKPSEIVEQVYAVQRDLKVKISNVVIMGMGEPLLNYDAVVKAIKILNEPDGLNISMRRITLSTCGIIPEIKRLAEENLQIVLAISLHAPTDELRNKLIPINRKYPLQELIAVCDEYTRITHRRITFEYALIAGVNDTPEHAYQLVNLLKGLLCHVNLIPINPVEGLGLERPDPKGVLKFKEIVQKGGIETTVREERGTDIDAACGQLRLRRSREV